MMKLRRHAALVIVLGLTACMDKCKGKKSDSVTAAEAAAAGGGNAAAGSLILAAREQGAVLPPELADPRLADEATLPMGPFKLPASNFSQAGTEVEPNDTESAATPMGPTLAIRGENRSGDYDHYSFETTGEPQLYAIEAVGKSVGNLLYEHAAGERVQAQQLDSGTLVIPNLLLAAGKHSIAVNPTSSASGAYTLRAIPLGKPDLRMEREPNDLSTFAHPLRSGIPRVGMLFNDDDRDYYRFALREPGRVLVQVTSPPGITLKVNVYREGNEPSLAYTASRSGESMRMDVLLPAGEYFVRVYSGEGGSRTPYKVRLDHLDPFSPPVDREPNTGPLDAAPLPPDLVLRGTVGEYNDEDWYQLPVVSRETTMKLKVMSAGGGMDAFSSTRIVNRKTGSNDYMNWAVGDTVSRDITLPADSPLFLQIYGKGSYQFQLSFSPGIPPIPGKAAYTVSLPPGPHLVEAFSTLAQRQPLAVTVNNPGAQQIQVTLEAVASHHAWTVNPSRQSLTVDAGKQVEVPLQVGIPPDAGAGEPVQIAVRASSPSGNASAVTKVYALCGATPANAQAHAPLPAQMLGGLNLASGSLGGRPVATGYQLERQEALYDDVNPIDRSWGGDRSASDSALTLTAELAGGRPASVTGVVLTQANYDFREQVDEFDVLVSEDGQAYRKVLSARLRLAPGEQVFPFPQPVKARFAQLALRTNQRGGSNDRFRLGEWKVIAAPGEHPFAEAELNIANPSRGGHVVWSQPLFSWPGSDAVLTDSTDESMMRLDPASPNEWVVGFRHNRAAQISRLEWLQPSAPGAAKLLSTVEVFISTESPNGPWTPVGSWKISAAPGSSTPLGLAKPVWARFVRFSTTEPKSSGDFWRLARTIRIYERPADASYRSVLAEWGENARPAIYERLVAAPKIEKVEEVTGNGKRDDAKKLESGKAYRGRVIVEEDEDWYRIDMPRGHNRLSVSLQGDPMLRAVASLQDESGKVIPAETQQRPGGIAHVEAIVEGGKTYFVRLVEPPRSIVLAWDNSSSVTPFAATLYPALSRFVEAVQPRKEFVNLLPFQDTDPKFLLREWSDQPFVLQGAVQNYGRTDGSSNAELALLSATRQLEQPQGSKAILFLTDAASNGYDKTAEVWAALSRVAARVFAVELIIGTEAPKQGQLMRDWADANDGHHATFRSAEDIDTAFDRTSCYLRRPARYTLTVETRFEEPPAPGALQVVFAPEAVAENAVEIILDASGSMLQMLGNRRRMDIARSTLVDLVEKTLPAGTPFAFRAFGTRMANCESDLLQKLQPLDRARTGAMVRKLNATNMAKTPLGASLKMVAEDLKGVKGQKIVVLLTDGEETCGGDPAASIQYLKQQGLDVRVNIVGFAVDQVELKASFERWAELGGGRFFDAKNQQELSKALTEAMRPKFQVTDAAGSVVAEGTAGGSPVELPTGTYTVRVLTSPVRTFERVQIRSKQQQRIEVKSGG